MAVTTRSSLDSLVGSVADARLEDVPTEAAGAVAWIVADTIAVALAGARRPEQRALAARLAEPCPDPATANVLGELPLRAPAPQAALLNGSAAIAEELDESLVGGGHPGSHVVPAALAVAQREDSSGEELLAAVLAGYEVSGRLFRHHRMRFPAHPHGAIGTIGAATAAARLTGADPIAAAAIAAELPLLATWSACFDGATARNAWSGAAAMIGVLAAEMAQAGFVPGSAPLQAIELVSEQTAAALEADLERPLVCESATRVYAVAGPMHTAVEAARELRVADPARIAAVRVETFAANRKFAAPPAPNDLSARFSLPHSVAVALTATILDAAAFGFREELRPLVERVEVEVAADLEDALPALQGARVTVETTDGEAREASCEYPLGHPRRPLSLAQRERRLEDLLGARADLAPALLGLAEQAGVAGLLAGGAE